MKYTNTTQHNQTTILTTDYTLNHAHSLTQLYIKHTIIRIPAPIPFHPPHTDVYKRQAVKQSCCLYPSNNTKNTKTVSLVYQCKYNSNNVALLNEAAPVTFSRRRNKKSLYSTLTYATGITFIGLHELCVHFVTVQSVIPLHL